MKENNKKKQVSEWALDDFLEKNNSVDDILTQTLEESFRHIYSILSLKQQIESQNSLVENRNITNIYTKLIEIKKYIPDEIIIFETNLMPLNYYKLESYRYYSEIKNVIIDSVYNKLFEINSKENGEIINCWKNSILIFQISKTGKVCDFDNYFCKPYVDGIRNSRFIKDDSANNLNIIYCNFDAPNSLLRATLINKKHLDKYKNLIFNCL